MCLKHFLCGVGGGRWPVEQDIVLPLALCYAERVTGTRQHLPCSEINTEMHRVASEAYAEAATPREAC